MTPMRMPRITVTIALKDEEPWLLELDAATVTSTDAPMLRGNVERVISLLRSYRDIFDHLIEIQSDTDARAIRRAGKEPSE